MKSITNDSLQSFEILFNYQNGPRRVWLKPKQTIVVPETAVSQQCLLMARRRILRIKTT